MNFTTEELARMLRKNDQLTLEIVTEPDRGIVLIPGSNEHDHQAALIRWARNHADRWPPLALLHAIPNGGHRSKSQGARLKAEGVTAGIPDLFLPAARHGLHGLYIEMKVGSNKPGADQRRCIDALLAAGYGCRVCWSAEEARQVLIWYLGEPDPQR